MTNIKIKNTLNLHGFSVRIKDIFLYWKLIIPLIISVAGIVTGSYIAKGEGHLYLFIERYIETLLLNKSDFNLPSDLIVLILIPSIFAIVLYFCGLSVFGGLISNSVPFFYSLLVGIISYYFYYNYTLKGLAYCVILIFPYAVLSLFSLILMTSECIIMSEYLINKTNQRKVFAEYSIKQYSVNYIKSYAFIVLSVLIKCILDSLFIGIFSF